MTSIESFSQLAASRRSVRNYLPDPVPDELLEQLVEAARWAPTAVNSQPWEFIIVTDPEVKAAVAQGARYYGLKWPQIAEAPALIVVCSRNMTPFARDDGIFAGANLMLAAADVGLGTCWIGGFKQDTIRTILAVPASYTVPGFCTVGYPDGDTAPPPKRELADMIHRDTFTGSAGGLGRLAGPLEVLGRLIRLQFRRAPSGTEEQTDKSPRQD